MAQDARMPSISPVEAAREVDLALSWGEPIFVKVRKLLCDKEKRLWKGGTSKVGVGFGELRRHAAGFAGTFSGLDGAAGLDPAGAEQGAGSLLRP